VESGCAISKTNEMDDSNGDAAAITESGNRKRAGDISFDSLPPPV